MEEFCLESQLKLSTFLLATKEQSEIDVSSGWTLCPLCLRFVRETVVESSSNIEEFGNAD
ncbi:hypothetical protein DY000_02026492 [Brassica cretica]|uniref:Uncharacterized protein n=1 Tax=Brassica cretica TaxID=69181 RepID=A0ABQ7EFP2_BRACR|nr:hypothetical protein DY000_02026492 [Brassica cretica]